MEEYIIIITTVPKQSIALSISDRLVEDRLVACAQINGPITSIYEWDNKIQRDEEWRLMMKTLKSKYAAVEEVIIEMHPYEVPQVIAIPMIDGYAPYLDWISGSSTQL